MLKKVATNGKMPSATEKPINNQTFGPPRIGPVLEERAYLLKLEPKDLAPLVGSTWRNIYKIFKRKYLSVQEMKMWSIALKENLFALYFPNWTTVSDVAEALLKEVEDLKKERDDLLNQVGIRDNQIIKLNAQKELLEDQVAEFLRRKG